MILKIAFRNMLRQKRRSALTLLSMFGGFFLASISIGWSDGTYSYIINMFTRNRLGQIQVHKRGYLDRPSLYETIPDYASIGKSIQEVSGVEAWAPRVYSAGLVSLGDKTAGVQLIGIDPDLEEGTTHFNRKINRGKPLSESPAPEALLGEGLMKIIGAKPGQNIVVLSQAADGSIANDLFRIIGVVATGDEISDRTAVYLNLQEEQDFLALDSEVHELVVVIYDLAKVANITAAIRARLSNTTLDVEPWQEFARSFYVAMKADQKGMWIMLFIITLVVAVGVLNTVLMSVLERRREYGLMKAVGTRPGQIVMLVLSEVCFLAIAGVALGALLSTAVNTLLSFRGIPLPAAFTYGGVEFSRMYSEVSARSLYIPAVTVIAAALLVSLPPAWKAAGTRPAQAMRTF